MKRITPTCEDAIKESVSIDTYKHILNDEIKKSGTTWKVKSPFGNEKTASCHIWSNMRFKDFSSGKSGDVFTILMENQAMSYPEALEHVAGIEQVHLEYEETEQDAELISRRNDMKGALTMSMDIYQQKLGKLAEDHPIIKHLREERQLDNESIAEWELGYAPGDGRYMRDKLLEQGLLLPALDVGLVKEKNGKQYDALRDCLVFPIRNKGGHLVGFACRNFSEKAPKYVNAPASELYDKSQILYGLNHAKSTIRLRNRIYISEGYFDVISMHRAAAQNTVATCGTALTPEHCAIIRKLTRNATILRDNDRAGRKAALRDFELLMQHDFNVDVCMLPEGSDPDDFVRQNIEPRKRFEPKTLDLV